LGDEGEGEAAAEEDGGEDDAEEAAAELEDGAEGDPAGMMPMTPRTTQGVSASKM